MTDESWTTLAHWRSVRDEALREAEADQHSKKPGFAAQARLRLEDLVSLTDDEMELLATSALGQEVARRLTQSGWSQSGVLLWWTSPNAHLMPATGDRPVDYARRIEAAISRAEAEAQGRVDLW